jgi:DNA-directed RNA polymerase subunit RPC12/RpoP
MPYECQTCSSKNTHNPKTRLKAWRKKGTLRKIVCPDCGKEFKTVELPLLDLDT